MARIPESELERIKREVSLVDLVKASGVTLEKKGKDLVGLCPFHDDHDPSLVVTPEKNLWHCLGACRMGGTVIDWIMKRDSVSFRHAVEILKGELPGDRAPLSSVSFSPDLSDQEIMMNYVHLCHQELKSSERAKEYLQSRGLDDPALIDAFKLGFSDRKLGYLLPSRDIKEGKEIRKRLEGLGILRESGHEHFSGSLVVPVFDEPGRVSEMYGRKIGGNLRKGTPKHLYLPGPHKGVFNFSAFADSKEIILCESLIDALTFYRHGFKNVTTSYGVNGFTPELMEAFKTHRPQRVLIAYDADEAGDIAALELTEKLVNQGLDVYRVRFPAGQDANEFSLRASSPREALSTLIERSEWVGQALYINNKKIAAIAAKEKKSEEQERRKSACEVPFEKKGEDVFFSFGERSWRIRGLSKNLSFDLLRVNVLLSFSEKFFVDSFDLYSARHRAQFIKQASGEVELSEETVKSDLGKILLKLEELQEEEINARLKGKSEKAVHEMTEVEKEEALKLLKSKNLLERILKDFLICGVVGERTNKLVGYLAAVSRKLDSPLAIIIQSSSSAGKTWLMESILSLMPPEERIKYSAMTGQSLYYLGESDLKHKILAIVEEEGAEKASYALKLLQSEGELSIASTGKDPQTGRLITQEYRVEGPVMILITTTSIEVDEELQNRCIILTVDESREQTRAIHKLQREKRTLEGLKRQEQKPLIRRLHQNAQRLLRPYKVMNPYAGRLTFLDDKTRTRRDHEKYLCLIDAITFLHQYQRQIKKEENLEYIVVELQDIEMANSLAHEVLGRSLDELPPQTRNLLLKIDSMVEDKVKRLKISRADYRFSRRTVREYTGWGNTQLKVHLSRLEDMEYLIVHRGGRGQSFCYELLYNGEGQDGKPFLSGLIDVERLKGKKRYDGKLSGVNESLSAFGRPQVGVWSAGGRVLKKAEEWFYNRLSLTLAAEAIEKALLGTHNETVMSYQGELR